MGIGLMSHIPDDLISRQIKGQVQGNGQLYNTQVGSQMPAGHTDLFDQELTDLRSQCL